MHNLSRCFNIFFQNISHLKSGVDANIKNFFYVNMPKYILCNYASVQIKTSLFKLT